MIYANLVRPAFPVETASFQPLASDQRKVSLREPRPARGAHRWTEPVSIAAMTTAVDHFDPSYEEPRSLLRYVVMAAFLVVPALAIFTVHVESSVAPVASYVAQVYGASAPTQIAAGGR